jgi:hypothetical protein
MGRRPVQLGVSGRQNPVQSAQSAQSVQSRPVLGGGSYYGMAVVVMLLLFTGGRG